MTVEPQFKLYGPLLWLVLMSARAFPREASELKSASKLDADILAAIMQDTFDKERILHRLMTSVGESKMRERAPLIAKARGIPEAAVVSYLKDNYSLSLPSKTAGSETLNQKMKGMIKQVQSPSAALHASHAVGLHPSCVHSALSRACLPHASCRMLSASTQLWHCQ